ncbi:MAG: hypothetical protein K2N20_04620 [Helicobacter sp.]|nr:hypothetical protein [Helicobacter sp.]
MTRFQVSLRASNASVAINEQRIPSKRSRRLIASASPRNDTAEVRF